MEDILTQPVTYYTELTGKNIRKYICNLLGLYLGVNKQNIDYVDNIVNMIHNASLVIDDIQDNSIVRRNQECAHIKYGIPLSINAGYLMAFKILNSINKNTELSEQVKYKLVENTYYAHLGQGMDIYYTTNKIIPTVEEYNTMIEYKTGMLFVTILDLLMEYTLYDTSYNTLCKCICDFSLFFQIRDDYINVTDPVYWKEKGFCQDFDEQKISYLITYCNQYKMKDYETIIKLLNEPTKTKEDKIKLVMLMKDNNLLDTVYNQLTELKQKVLESLDIRFIFDQLPFHKFQETHLSCL